jgi:hypothetical protein
MYSVKKIIDDGAGSLLPKYYSIGKMLNSMINKADIFCNK